MTTDRSDAWLVERFRAGDESAFAELVRRYRQPVFRLAVSVLGQAFAADAEDVAQDVMVRLYHAIGSYRGDAAFGTWVYRIAYNHAVNVKARMRYRAPHVHDDAIAGLPSSDRRPDDTLREEERRRAVLDCISDLPDVYQAALRLHYWLGTSVRDIAVMLDVPENTVKSYLFRARRLLHAMLSTRGFDAD